MTCKLDRVHGSVEVIPVGTITSQYHCITFRSAVDDTSCNPMDVRLVLSGKIDQIDVTFCRR